MRWAWRGAPEAAPEEPPAGPGGAPGAGAEGLAARAATAARQSAKVEKALLPPLQKSWRADMVSGTAHDESCGFRGSEQVRRVV